MNRDQLYEEIRQRLAGALDGELFERAACGLLRPVYPSLVPIHGGTDAGMDGATAHTQGGHLLVATTGSDVIGNLSRNLETHKRRRNDRSLVIVATSQVLTERRRRNLERRADELGFLIDAIHDGEALADLLYHEPEWCNDLLGISGDRPPLSAIPRTSRPRTSAALVGREADQQWLEKTPGDLVLVGQPGIGKTALLAEFVNVGRGLFLVDQDLSRLPPAVRSQQPLSVIVDDAHGDTNLLANLAHLREEVAADFRIVASCWPGGVAEVTRALMVPSSQVRELPLLDRDQILLVIRQAMGEGVHAPERLLRELVDQAAGKPGLAVTLTNLCLHGDIHKVATGEALVEEISQKLAPLVDEHTLAVLAGFSIGGCRGMPLDVVAESLQFKPARVQLILNRVAFGGVVVEHASDIAGVMGTLEIVPEALRHALVGDVFYSGAASLSYAAQSLIRKVPDNRQAVLTLIGAKARGAAVPERDLRDMVESAHSEEAWLAYSSLGEDQLKWVLEKHPERLLAIAALAVDMLPRRVAPMLLDMAVGDERPLDQHPDHPIRILQDWVKAGPPGTGEPLRRRRTLLAATLEWAKRGDGPEDALRVLASCVSLDYFEGRSDAGMGRTFTIATGSVTSDEARDIARLWREVVSFVRQAEVESWRPLQNAVWKWAHAGARAGGAPEDVVEFARGIAREVLTELSDLAEEQGRLGVLKWARDLARRGHLRVEVPAHSEFDTLFPDDTQKAEQLGQAIRRLADQWCAEKPREVAEKIQRYEHCAQAAGISSRLTVQVCSLIAEATGDPRAWAEALLDAGAVPDLVEPFLVRALDSQPAPSLALVQACLDSPTRRAFAVGLALTRDDLPELRDAAMGHASACVGSMCGWARRGALPAETERRLLKHHDPRVVGAVAQGTWGRLRTEGTSPSDAVLRAAVARSVEDDHWLAEECGRDPALAKEWLMGRLSRDAFPSWQYAQTTSAAIAAIAVADREELLRGLSPEAAGWVDTLVGNDVGLYRTLLSLGRLRGHHLTPLARDADDAWEGLARAALDAGFTCEDVVAASGSRARSWSGSESAMWKSVRARWQALAQVADDRIREVARALTLRAEERREAAAGRERREAVFGGRLW